MKKGVTITIVIALLAALLLYFYGRLGGFNSVEISVESCEDRKLMGMHFKGTPQSNELPLTFKRVSNFKKETSKTGLYTIYYTEPAGKLDTLHLFVGVEAVSGDVLPHDLELVSIPCEQMILAKVSSHRLVMPSPKKVRQKIQAFATKNNLELKGEFMDKILDEKNVEVLAPLSPTKR
ncbi:hypothetical protein [Pleomorphovibrio marinus]|uniref:hypothetical protein n=1 Tax=Pleomorphovibrio marinus TaxID=2164132 RepID=UPI000E0BDF3B|nr:hypothetical protein [Pleomorphovibrio marinus]